MAASNASKGPKLLKAYLDRNNKRQADLKTALNVSRPVVSEWLGGTRRPSEEKRKLIEAWTGGAVPASSWETEKDRAKRDAAARVLESILAERQAATGTEG